MSKYFINIFFIIIASLPLSSQNQEKTNSNDSLVGFNQKYGIRVGFDLSRLGRTILDSYYNGFEINADYRISKRLYIAGELGFENKETDSDYLNSKASGSYFKAGVDFNLYNNWVGMENLIISGFRIGVSSFNQDRQEYKIYDAYNQTWGEVQNQENLEFSGLASSWIELLFGVKTEIISNLFLSFNVQLKVRLTETNPNNFENIFIPGFGRTYDSTKIGTGINYSISYLIPIFKKKSVINSN